jgi:hypothetical protein
MADGKWMRVQTLDWRQADGDWLLVPCLGSSPNQIPSLFNRGGEAFPTVAHPGDALALVGPNRNPARNLQLRELLASPSELLASPSESS